MVITDEIGSTIKDLHSLNGTFLNNKKISESMLKDGDIISIGKFNILFKNNTLELCENQEIIDNDEIQYPIFSLSPTFSLLLSAYIRSASGGFPSDRYPS